jgi:tRNA threonylcarbamoyl adenosine modification protein YjeE
LPTRRETKRLAKSIAAHVAPGDLFVVSGPLGAGKTFLVRAVLRSLGLDERVAVTSPTFTLVNEYATSPPVAHADLYRIESAADVERLGLVEQRDLGRALFVEWGGAFVDALGGDAVVVKLAVEPRSAALSATGTRSAERLAQITRGRGA